MPLRFLSRLHLRRFTVVHSQLCTLHGSHHFSVVSQSVCPAFASPCLFHPSFFSPSHIGLHKFKWTSLALQAQSRVDKVWFHPLSSPLFVCACVRGCGCWCQDCLYELRLLSRRGELLSEPGPSVNVSTMGRCLRVTLPPSTFPPHPFFQSIAASFLFFFFCPLGFYFSSSHWS